MTTRVLTGLLIALSLIGAGCATAPASPAASVTLAEQAVRTTLERYWEASRKADVDRLIVHYADDARIDSIVAGGKVTKAVYEAAMRKWLETPANRQITSNYRIVKVAFPSPTEAIVDTDVVTSRSGGFSGGGFSRNRSVQWRLEDRAGRWLIAETTYTKR
jgi:hypothetical protein